ncbi:MAG: hypothetical protein ACODAE_02180 [Gemmatimonadota bacterium]
MVGELRSRTGSLYRQASGRAGPLTSDRRSQFDHYDDMMTRLARRIAALAGADAAAQ